MALVGGSGSGKTTLGRTIAGLVRESEGEIRFQGRTRDADWTDYRLNCQMVFQDPYSSLDPRTTILALVEEALRLVPGLDAAAKRKRALETLEEVGLGADYAQRYPHELSGGQRQRVAIARAVARRPRFLIADEPVFALDVTVRAQVLDLFRICRSATAFPACSSVTISVSSNRWPIGSSSCRTAGSSKRAIATRFSTSRKRPTRAGFSRPFPPSIRTTRAA